MKNSREFVSSINLCVSPNNDIHIAISSIETLYGRKCSFYGINLLRETWILIVSQHKHDMVFPPGGVSRKKLFSVVLLFEIEENAAGVSFNTH